MNDNLLNTIQSDSKQPKRKRAKSLEARQRQLVAKALDKVEERIDSGEATAQELVHFLRLGTEQAKVELEKAKLDNELIKAKTKAYESAEDMKVMFEEAVKAMKSYSPTQESQDEEEEY